MAGGNKCMQMRMSRYILQQTFARFTCFGCSYGALALSCFKYALALEAASKGCVTDLILKGSEDCSHARCST
jgi:hypothetical protein